MGKKAKFKAIRRMAEKMPELKTIRKTGVVMTGKQLIEEGQTEANGEPVNPTTVYKATRNDVVSMNHEKNMKQLYYKHGAKGVRAYMLNVENHLNGNKQKETI